MYPVSDENWVEVVPHPPLWGQVEVDPREGLHQFLVEFEEVGEAPVDVPVGNLGPVPVTPLLNFQLVDLEQIVKQQNENFKL